MSIKDAILTGAGGGGKGGGGTTFHNRPDNLRSEDTYEILLGLGAGRIRPAPGGLKNVFVNNVPVEDADGKATFKDFAAVLFDGDPTVLEPIQLRLGGSSGAVGVGVDLANPSASLPGDWVLGAITASGCDYIDLRFVVQQLFNQNKDGVFNATASIEINMRPAGMSTWINPLVGVAGTHQQDGTPIGNTGGFRLFLQRALYNDAGTAFIDPAAGYLQITGKTTSAFVKEIRIAVPNTGAYANKAWEVRCRLMEQDEYVLDDTQILRSITWESLAGVNTDPIGGTEAWRGVSWMQVYGKATDQINGRPTITMVADLNDFKVPPNSVWDPVTRVYTGAAWDGATTQIKWTQCPAWQIKGVIEDPLSGVSALVPGSTLNKWDALEASKWFAQIVPDGAGGYHPRYSLNWYIDSPQNVHEFVNYLAGAVGGLAWDEGNGQWRLKVEKPENPTMIFTKEDIDGEFVYSHTDIDSRFNHLIGVYRDKERRYEESRVRTFDQPDIDLSGYRPTSVALVGCDNRQEALRRLELRKLTALNETRMVTFKATRKAELLSQLSTICVADGDLNSDSSIRSTGRVVTMNNTRDQITLRDTLRLEIGVAYTIQLGVPNPDYNPDTTSEPSSPEWRKPTITIERTVMNTAGQRGDVRTLYLDAPLPENTPEFVSIALSAPGLPSLPKQYRVLGVQPNETRDMFTVTGIEIYTSKWDESDNVDESVILGQVPGIMPPPTAPAGGVWELRNFQSDYTLKRLLTASWVRPHTAAFDKYRIELRQNDGPWEQKGTTRDSYYEIKDPEQGTYDIRVYAVRRDGMESLPLEASTTVGALPTGLSVSYGAASINALYDDTGATPQNLPLDEVYKLSANGIELTTGVTWQYRVITGQVNGKVPANSWQTMTVTGGAGTFDLDTVEVAGTIEVRGTTISGSASKTVTITKTLAAPATGGGSSSSGGPTGSILTPWTSFVTIVDGLSITLPTGKTATRTVVDLTPKWAPNGAINEGEWDIEFKLQRNVSGTWTDVGTLQHSYADPYIEDVNGGEDGAPPFYRSFAGAMSATINDTALTAGSTYDYRVVARIGSGVTAGHTGGIGFTGTVSITAP